ncbi:MAG: hypothetical protein PHV23_01535 [Candidatus Gracilibacteria bacterium]|nr:hypothetical protein [Candidatus Gracilibacteria bacterium]
MKTMNSSMKSDMFDYNFENNNSFRVFINILDKYTEINSNFEGNISLVKDNQKAFFTLGINSIKGYLNYLNDLLILLKNQSMKIENLETILDLEEEINEVISILNDGNLFLDWKGLKKHIDSLQSRVSGISNEVSSYNSIKNTIYLEKQSKLRQDAWLKFINSGNVKNASIYRIQNNLSPEFSLNSTTNDYIEGIKKSTNEIYPGIKSLDLRNPNILKAIKSAQLKESDGVNNFSAQLRHDLHKVFGEAVNDELYYNSLSDTLNSKDINDIVSLNIVGYDKFDIVSFQKISGSNHFKLKVEIKGISSDKEQVIEIFCNPEKVISGQQARIGILQKDGTTKIELLNINKISNSGVRIKKETLNTPKKSSGLWGSLKKGFSSIFSRKEA